MLREHEIEIRVRYQETDGQGRLHHANYLNYFEVGRVELMRAAGFSYREMEAEGLLLVVSQISCRYIAPAKYDDLLQLRTTTIRCKGVRIEHRYELFHDGQLLAEGRSLVACVDSTGKVCRLPQWLQLEQDG